MLYTPSKKNKNEIIIIFDHLKKWSGFGATADLNLSY